MSLDESVGTSDANMRGATALPLKPVRTISGDQLATLCGDLWHRMESSGFTPELVVGIVTGGEWVARQMPTPPETRVASCRLRRPSTARKSRRGSWSRLLPLLPYGITNPLRLAEDWNGARRQTDIPAPSAELLDEVEQIRAIVEDNQLKRVAVVDDAVDSGATLACVVNALRDALPDRVDLRSAAITVTRPHVAAMAPDYRIFDRTLLRFPWSFDYRGAA